MEKLGLNRSDINTVRALRESARQLCRMKIKKLPRWCQSARVCVVVLESWVEDAQFLGTPEKAISYHPPHLTSPHLTLPYNRIK